MAREFDGSNQYLATGSILEELPITLACWFWSDASAAYQALMALDESGGPLNGIALEVRGDVGGDPVRAASWEEGDLTHFADTGNSTTFNTWQHACGVWAASNDRTAYLNGDTDNKGTNSDDFHPGVLDVTSIGGLEWDSNYTAFMSGRICEAAIWTVALTDGEVAALADRISPILVRRDALVAYWPLGGAHNEDDIDIVGGFDLTPVNSPTFSTALSNHAPIVHPALPGMSREAAAFSGNSWYYLNHLARPA